MTSKTQQCAQQMLDWVDARFPASKLFKEHMSEYYAPKNFNFWYYFGVLSLLVLVIQIVTGIFLAMHYKPDASLNAAGIPIAFASVDYIMRDVPGGWIIRYLHSTGASAFFIVVYLHMFRGLLYGSYRKPRELVWLFGVAIFLCLMAEAFFGYLLPWGQMSFWGAQVIVNLFSAIPVVGPDLSLLIRGDFVVSDATLNRFFSFHVIAIPLVLLGLVVAHVIALHEVGSNNPDGVEIKEHKDANGIPLDGIPFHPYYTVKDSFISVIFLMVFCAVVFFLPEGNGYFLEYNNFLQANPMQTPPHIAPVWYFTPFYSMLRATTSEFLPLLWLLVVIVCGLVARGTRCACTRWAMLVIALALYWAFFGFSLGGVNYFAILGNWAAVIGLDGVSQALGRLSTAGNWAAPWFSLTILGVDLGAGLPAKFWGVVVMGGTVLVLALLPWIDQSPVKSIRYKGPVFKTLVALFVVVFVVLGYYGTQAPTDLGNMISQIGTILYIAFFAFMPWYTRWEKTLPVPERVTA